MLEANLQPAHSRSELEADEWISGMLTTSRQQCAAWQSCAANNIPESCHCCLCSHDDQEMLHLWKSRIIEVLSDRWPALAYCKTYLLARQVSGALAFDCWSPQSCCCPGPRTVDHHLPL